MLIKNYELGFSYELSDDYSEIKESSYKAFGVGPNTLGYFVQLDEAGEIDKVFSLVKDKVCINDEEIKTLIDQNIKTLKKAGFDMVYENDFETDQGRKIYRRVFVDETKELTYVTYFTLIHNTIVTSTTQILDFYDEYEEEMYAVFASITEI